MPIYTWTTQEGALSDVQRRALAKVVTDIHCNATGAPREFVRVIFSVYTRGSGFLGYTESAAAVLVCQIRAGRTLETKHSIMRQLNDAAMEIGGISRAALAIVVQEIAPAHGMEFGAILPKATPEEEREWLAVHRP